MAPRIATVGTVDQLRQVFAFAAPILCLPCGKHTLEYYVEQFTRTPQLLVYAEQEDEVCGCVLGSIEGDHVLVGPVAVAETSRRMGIGAAMMQEVETQARQLGQHTLILGAREGAEPFYLRCGFQPHLFVQLPQADGLARLRALNERYPANWETEADGWSRLMLRLPALDSELQHRYQEAFPDCHAGYVFIKHICPH